MTLRVALRGDVAGHAFHGNQWTGGEGGGTEPVKGSGPTTITVPTTLSDAPPNTKAEILDRQNPPQEQLSPGWRNTAAWELIQTPQARALGNPEQENPDRYQANKGFGVSLKDGEVETRIAHDVVAQNWKQGATPSLEDVTTMPKGMNVDQAREAGYTFASGSGEAGRPLVVVPDSQRAPDDVYRVMSTGEYDQAKERGYIQTDQRMNFGNEGTVTSLHSTGSFYAPGTSSNNADYRIARIAYNASDGWTIDHDEYIKTQEKIPFSRVTAVTEPLPNPRAQRDHHPLRLVMRGDVAGHAFHGNQWTGGMGGGGTVVADKIDLTTKYVEKWGRGFQDRQDPALSTYQNIAVNEYTKKYVARDLNNALRSGEPLDDEQRTLTSLVDGAITQRQTTADSTAYRGIATSHQFVVGDEFTDKGFVSVSVSEESAKMFSSGAFGTQSRVTVDDGTQPWLATIHVPQGTDYARGAVSIQEHVLGRDTAFRVTDVGPPLDPNDYGKSRTLSLEIVR